MKYKNLQKIKQNRACPLKLERSRGFVILFAVTLSALILAIALGVANVALKEVKFSTSAKDTNNAFFAADTGVESALFNDKNGNYNTAPGTWSLVVSGLGSSGQSCAKVSVAKTIAPSVTTIISKGYDIGDGSCNSPNPNRIEREIKTTYGGSSALPPPPSDSVWVEDSLPAGATSQGDLFNWVSSNPTQFSGSSANQSQNTLGTHQQYFTGASPTLNVQTGDTMVVYVYMNTASPPSQIEIQWNSNEQGWNHRAFWNNSGIDQIGYGNQGTQSLRYMGVLPQMGVWVRLEISASLVGLEGLHVNGMAFTLYDGQATWDHAGKNP